jgi:hypothetical protein
VRILMAAEEHGAGKQLIRVRAWPMESTGLLAVLSMLLLFSLGAAFAHAWVPSASFAITGLVLFLRMFQDCAAATAAVARALTEAGAEEEP